jgi:SpoVK/Ycf46/Vps4 family AAA+-type ATPase
MAWPTVGGFSFSAKQWGEILVESACDVVFDDRAFERLVLAEQKKTLILSLVENKHKVSFADVISGKGGGCIFLLHGKPGVGKTLTAEAIAELLHRPLYSVSVGELGTKTEELEKRLKEILEVASSWDAVILIDEADIFLERRTENDIVRSSTVGIFLRRLELVFATTPATARVSPGRAVPHHQPRQIVRRRLPLAHLRRPQVLGPRPCPRAWQ